MQLTIIVWAFVFIAAMSAAQLFVELRKETVQPKLCMTLTMIMTAALVGLSMTGL